VYKEHICLWNVEHKSLLNRDIREKAQQQVLNFSNNTSASTTMYLLVAATPTNRFAHGTLVVGRETTLHF
jgi:hypothetical protein